MGGPRYTPDQLRMLTQEYRDASSVAALAKLLGRSAEAVKQKALELGLHRPRTIPPEDPRNAVMTLIVKLYPNAPDLARLARDLGLTPGSLKGYAYRLGVKRSRKVAQLGRAKGGRASVAVRRAKAIERKLGLQPTPEAYHIKQLLATPLDAAWRGLLQKTA